jgi:Ca2+:H+ antiporter
MKSLLKPSLNWLLIFVPISICLRFVPFLSHDTALFITSCLSIIPLAGWMGKATEHLAANMGQGVGALLNATFGNAAELIIALVALSKGLIGVVKASITGSIIGNILLVLGLSILSGGLKFNRQTFNKTAAHALSTTLILAAIALIIPTVFHMAADQVKGGWTPAAEQRLSLAIAIVLFVTYLATLIFSLRTHKALFTGESHDTQNTEPHRHWSRKKALIVLFCATAFVALMSEFLVGTVESARTAFGLTEVFVGIVIVAVIGNAAEHSTAILMALKNKMDLSVGIAIGSSLQIALFVAPVLVFASYPLGHPMNLEFSLAEVVAVFAAVFIVAQISADGECNWLEGLQLLAVYIILAILFFFLPEATHTTDLTSAINSNVLKH